MVCNNESELRLANQQGFIWCSRTCSRDFPKSRCKQSVVNLTKANFEKPLCKISESEICLTVSTKLGVSNNLKYRLGIRFLESYNRIAVQRV